MNNNKHIEPFRKVLDDFLYHYKFHVIFGFILLIFIGLMLYTTASNQVENYQAKKMPPADIDILLFGNYKVGIEQEKLEANLQAAFPEWEAINLQIEYAPSDTESYDDIASMQRSIAVLHTVKPDVYIFDRHQFDKFIEDGTFVRLDDYFTEQENLLKHQKQADEQTHTYGIDISNSELFSDLEIKSIDKIAVISSKTETLNNALLFIERALK